MLPIKLELTNELAATLRKLRLDHPVNGEVLTAEKLSLAIGNNRAWMSQIESRRLKKVKREDIISIYKFLFSINDEEAENKAEIDLKNFFVKKPEKTIFYGGKNSKVIFSQKNKKNNKTEFNQKNRLNDLEKNTIKDFSDILSDGFDNIVDTRDKLRCLYFLKSVKESFSESLYDSANIYSQIPAHLYKYGNDEEKQDISYLMNEVKNKLLLLKPKKTIYSLEERINLLSSGKLRNSDLKIWHIIHGLLELSELSSSEFPLSQEEKKQYFNNYIAAVNNSKLSLDTEISYTIMPLEETCTISDLKDKITELQLYISSVQKDIPVYLLNKASDYFE